MVAAQRWAAFFLLLLFENHLLQISAQANGFAFDSNFFHLI